MFIISACRRDAGRKHTLFENNGKQISLCMTIEVFPASYILHFLFPVLPILGISMCKLCLLKALERKLFPCLQTVLMIILHTKITTSEWNVVQTALTMIILTSFTFDLAAQNFFLLLMLHLIWIGSQKSKLWCHFHPPFELRGGKNSDVYRHCYRFNTLTSACWVI